MEKWVEVDSVKGNAECVCIATFLPLGKWRYLIPFLRMSFRVEGQLKRSRGILGYGLRAYVFQKRFWTLSVWNDRASVSAFVGASPHATAVKQFERWAGPGAAFVQWSQPGDRPGWKEALERLKTPAFYYRAANSGGAEHRSKGA